LFIRKKKELVRKMSLLKDTEGLAGARLWVQLGPVVGTLMSLSVNNRGCLGYPTASSPREENILSMLNLVGMAL
jgi:hypothetical protein